MNKLEFIEKINNIVVKSYYFDYDEFNKILSDNNIDLKNSA